MALWHHSAFELAGYGSAVALFLWQRRRQGDPLPVEFRTAVTAAAFAGAALGSKLLALLIEPAKWLAHWNDPAFYLSGKTIVGGLIGGWLAVELVKRLLGIVVATGDLFALPICVGGAIGRIGCFLAGLPDGTHGNPTALPWGYDFGDAIPRHPTQLYESAFFLILAGALVLTRTRAWASGTRFRIVMISYLSLRLLLDFIKPIPALWLGMSAIQWACATCLIGFGSAFALIHIRPNDPVVVSHA